MACLHILEFRLFASCAIVVGYRSLARSLKLRFSFVRIFHHVIRFRFAYLSPVNVNIYNICEKSRFLASVAIIIRDTGTTALDYLRFSVVEPIQLTDFNLLFARASICWKISEDGQKVFA